MYGRRRTECSVLRETAQSRVLRSIHKPTPQEPQECHTTSLTLQDAPLQTLVTSEVLTSLRRQLSQLGLEMEKVMSHKDRRRTEEARKKRDEKEAAEAGRQGRKRKKSAPAPPPCRGKKPRTEEVEEARKEIKALRIESFCSVFGL